MSTRIKTPKSYFCLRASLAPSPSTLPALMMGALAAVIIVGVFLNIAVLTH